MVLPSSTSNTKEDARTWLRLKRKLHVNDQPESSAGWQTQRHRCKTSKHMQSKPTTEQAAKECAKVVKKLEPQHSSQVRSSSEKEIHHSGEDGMDIEDAMETLRRCPQAHFHDFLTAQMT
ncbi:hypothetical protein NDU88_005212 [Pleurodeles waltl]|uniref:Uncharacterized protein n=1 Tax=Pleurodeles waltl TaxID=8319 RepID=A0AAV7WWF5_PLEWA|nr:hypothetical protein NDU88_005212 [Pleurodeles waltl]